MLRLDSATFLVILLNNICCICRSQDKPRDRDRGNDRNRERNRDRDNRRDRRDSGRRDGGRRDQRGGRFHPYGGRDRDGGGGRDKTVCRSVFVSNIPFEIKWQELKDIMRKEGELKPWAQIC